MSLLRGQTAGVTGGAQGLGLAIAERFIAEGARVVLGDVNLEATEAAAKQLGGQEGAVAARCETAKDIAHVGVRVNAIAPGLTRPGMTEAMPQRIWDSKVAEVPMGRAGEPSEVASVALFLASDLSSYMTGTVMEITGGRHL